MYPIIPTFPRPSQFLAATLLTFWSTTHQALSQIHDGAFGIVQVYSTPGRCGSLRLINERKTDAQRLITWLPGSTVLYSTRFPFSDSAVVFHSHSALAPFDDVLSADLTGDGVEELILVRKAEKTLSIVTNTSSDTLRPVNVLRLDIEPTRVIVGDINNDKRPDLLVADRNNPGVLPFFGQGNGLFRQGTLIAPENAVGDMALVYLNNDLLVDLVFYDWVKSELHCSYGVGRGRFLDLTTLPVNGMVQALTVTSLGKHRFTDLVLVLQQPMELQVWAGDATGDFRLRSSFPLKSPPVSLDLADLDNDGGKEFALLERNGTLKVLLNPSEETRPSSVEYFAGRDATQLLLADVNSDGKVDALVLRSERRQLAVYYNAAQANVLTDSLQFATGLEPTGVWIGDLNNDKQNDLLLVNRASNALSVYAGRGEQGLFGQTMLPLPPGPKQLAYHSATDSTVDFFVSHPATQSISFLTLHRNDLSSVNALIPNVGEMEFLYGSVSPGGRAEFFCYNSAGEAKSPSLVFYQQLGQTTFVERTFRLTIPDVLLGVAMGDVNKDGLPDVAYVYRNNELNRNELILSLGDSALSFRTRLQTLPLPEGATRKSYMWMSDFDRNDTLDLLLVFPQTLKQMMLAMGTVDRKFQNVNKIQSNIALADRSQLLILDLNNDGILDLAMNNSATATLGWYQGTGDGSFLEWKPLVRAADIGHFAFGDLNGDGVQDLAMTLRSEGLLKLYDGKRLLGSKGNDSAR